LSHGEIFILPVTCRCEWGDRWPTSDRNMGPALRQPFSEPVKLFTKHVIVTSPVWLNHM